MPGLMSDKTARWLQLLQVAEKVMCTLVAAPTAAPASVMIAGRCQALLVDYWAG
jgi:hypothetical protein